MKGHPILFFPVLVITVEDNFSQKTQNWLRRFKAKWPIYNKCVVFDNEKLTTVKNNSILTSTAKLLQNIERFTNSLFIWLLSEMVPLNLLSFLKVTWN